MVTSNVGVSAILILLANLILATFGDRECVAHEPDRIDCNPRGGGGSLTCDDIDCCYESAPSGRAWCTFPVQCSIEQSYRVNCGNADNVDDCLAEGCCWEMSSQGQCFLSGIECADYTFHENGNCIGCNCNTPCEKATGECDSFCYYGYIGNTCQDGESTPRIKSFTQDETPNSGYAATFTCTVQANEEIMVVSLHTQTSVYTGYVTHGTHPNYEFINNFNDVVVTKDEIVTCLLTPGDQQQSINANAYIQPVLTRDPWITDIGRNQMKVNWNDWDSSVDIGDDPIQQYGLWYKVTGDDEFEEYDTTIPPQTTIIVTGLTPYTSYIFAVKTYRPGEGGGGDLGPDVTEHTLCDVPLGTPSVEAAMTISENEIMVFWKLNDTNLAPETLRCESMTSYTMYYRVAGTQTYYDQRVVGPDETSFLLDGLDPCTEYEISLSMDNAVGNGQLSDSVFNTTHSSTPQEVEWLSAHAVSSSDIKITWSQPVTVDCPLESYRLDFQQETTSECGDEQNFQSLYFDETQFEYLATNLYASTNYKATVTAHTNGGGGPPSSVTEVTHEGVPSEPRDVWAEGVSGTEIEVTWTAPSCPNGTVISYMIIYWQPTDHNITNAVEAPQVCSNFTDALSCEIADLQPETNYSVQVSAENGCCFSGWSDTAQGSTLTLQVTPPASGSSVGVLVFTSITLTLVIVLVILFFLGYLYTKRTGKSWSEMFSKRNVDLSEVTQERPQDGFPDDNAQYADIDDVTQRSTELTPSSKPQNNQEDNDYIFKALSLRSGI